MCGEAHPGVASNGLPISLAVQDVGIVIQTVDPIGLLKSLLLHPGDGQQVAMRLRVRRSAENFDIVEDDGLQIHAYKLPEMRCYGLAETGLLCPSSCRAGPFSSRKRPLLEKLSTPHISCFCSITTCKRDGNRWGRLEQRDSSGLREPNGIWEKHPGRSSWPDCARQAPGS